jgi:hypothetical protein
MLSDMLGKPWKMIIFIVLILCIVGIIAYSSYYCCSRPAPTEVSNQTWIEFMRKIPAGYQDFEFWDAGVMRNNRDLAGIYDVWLERRGGYHNIISLDDIEYRASGDALTMVTGDLPLDDIRDKLSEYYYRDNGYTDSEVWLLKPEHQDRGLTGAFVLDDGLVVWGNKFNIDGYLGVISEGRPSFCKDDVAAIVGRLPSGIMVRVSVSTVTGLGSITATTVELVEKGVFRWTSVTRFLDTDEIADHLIELYMESLENDFRRAEEIYGDSSEISPFHDFTIERKGPDITWSVLVNEEQMISLLFYG